MSGLKVIFHKSDMFCFGEAINKQDMYNMILTCKIGTLPMKYLGININKKRIQNTY